MKKYLLMGFVGLICIFTLCGCDNKKTNNDKDTTKTLVEKGPFNLTNGKLDDKIVADGLKLSNTIFEVIDGKTTYSTDVTNISSSDITIYELHIIIKNAAKEEMVRFKTRIDNIAAGETKSVSTSMDFKLEGYSTIEYEIKTEA